MIKAFVTDAVVSKGYNGQDALKYSEDGKSVRFRIAKRSTIPDAKTTLAGLISA